MDLNAPLGLTPPPPPPRRWFVVLAGVLGALGFAGLGLALAWGDPHGGRPFVVVDLPPPPAPSPRPAVAAVAPVASLDTTPTASVAPERIIRPPAEADHAGSLEGGVLVHRGPFEGGENARTSPAGPLVIDVTRVLDAPPGRAKGAPAAAVPASQPRMPRVAIFVAGMGLDANATRTATEAMPPAVTLAFLPYGADLPRAVSAATSRGHEVLLQLPMRNEGGSQPGPHALRADSSPEALKHDLAWLMDRFAGYDGVSNLLGAAVTSDAATMTIVLQTARARHLFYLDDGTSRRSIAPDLAPGLGAEVVKTDLVLDATGDPAVVRANLDELVAIAKRKGRAVGMASGLPEHLGTIARFAGGLAARGIALVPVNALRSGDEVSAGGMAAAR